MWGADQSLCLNISFLKSLNEFRQKFPEEGGDIWY
jgi:hypothetical protein